MHSLQNGDTFQQTLYTRPDTLATMENTSTITKLRIVKPPEQKFSCLLRRTALFSNLSDKELACFQAAAQTRSYKKGKVLYIEEDTAKFFYVIVSGWIKLFHTTAEGEEVIVDMLTAGHIVGENSIFEEGLHTSSAVVIGDVQLISIPAPMLKEQIRFNPTLALSMLSAMSRHHRQHYDEIAINALQSAPQRIGSFLLRLCPQDAKCHIVLQLPYDKTLISHILGMNGATFSRALNILRQKTDINVQGSRVEIVSVQQLTQFVYGASSFLSTPDPKHSRPTARDTSFAYSAPTASRSGYELARHAI